MSEVNRERVKFARILIETTADENDARLELRLAHDALASLVTGEDMLMIEAHLVAPESVVNNDEEVQYTVRALLETALGLLDQAGDAAALLNQADAAQEEN